MKQRAAGFHLFSLVILPFFFLPGSPRWDCGVVTSSQLACERSNLSVFTLSALSIITPLLYPKTPDILSLAQNHD